MSEILKHQKYKTFITRWSHRLRPEEFDKALRLVNRYAVSTLENLERIALFDITPDYILVRPAYACTHGEPLFIHKCDGGYSLVGTDYFFQHARASCAAYDLHLKCVLLLIEHSCNGFDVEKKCDKEQWLEARTQIQLRLGLSLFEGRPNPPTWLTPLQIWDLDNLSAGEDPILEEIEQLQQQGSE